MGGKRPVPKGWLCYSKIGRNIPGTKFIPFKVPLRKEISQGLPQEEWFTPADLLRKLKNLKLIVNLTNAADGRYYSFNDFQKRGITVVHIECAGHGVLPPPKQMCRFFQIVDNFMNAAATDDDSLIGVHCTHGLNRTGYFICRYMSERMDMSVNNAIKLFEDARGHTIIREMYITDLRKNEKSRKNLKSEASDQELPDQEEPVIPAIENWRSRPNIDSDWNTSFNSLNSSDGNTSRAPREGPTKRKTTHYQRGGGAGYGTSKNSNDDYGNFGRSYDSTGKEKHYKNLSYISRNGQCGAGSSRDTRHNKGTKRKLKQTDDFWK